MYYKSLRIATTERKQVKIFLDKYAECYVVSWEVGSKTGKSHCHIYMETQSKDAALRKMIRQMFNPQNDPSLKGNALYSLKELDEALPLEYCSYIIKDGEYEFVNIPVDKQLEIQMYQDKVVKQMQDKKNKKLNKFKTILELCKNAISEVNTSIREPSASDDHDREVCAVTITRYYYENELQINTFRMKALLETICLHLRPENKENAIIRFAHQNLLN